MSLRERRKALRAREIVDAAATLFGDRGYDNTTVEDVAAYAGVAPGTVYNHFRSKDGLLHGILRVHIEERRAEREEYFRTVPTGMDAAIEAFLGLLLDRAFVLVNREIWRQVLASGISGGRNREDLLTEVTGSIVAQFEELFRIFGERGEIAAGTPLRDLAEAAMGIADFHFYRLVCHEELDVEDIKGKIRDQLNLLLRGAAAP